MKGPIARGTIRTTFVLGLRLAVQAGTLLIVARLLGPYRFGAFAGLTSLAVILGTLSNFGTHLVLLSEVSRDPARRQFVLAYAVPTTLFCGAGLMAIYLSLSTLALGDAAIAWHVLIAIGVTETLLQPLFGLSTTEHLALGRIARSQLLTILPLILRLTAAAAAWFLHFYDPLTTYAYGYLVASLIALTIATITLPAPWPRPSTWRFASKTEMNAAAGYAALGLTAASPAELDKTLAAKVLPLGAAGVYAVGARVIGATTLPVIAMMLSALPRLFREGQTEPKRTSHLLSWIFGATMAYSLALTVALWFLASLFDWAFGAKYVGLGHMIRWLCFATIGMSLRMAAGSVLMTLDRPWMRVGFEFAGMVILVIAAAMLTTRFGAIGMPLALACSEWGMAIIGAICIFHVQSISYQRVSIT